MTPYDPSETNPNLRRPLPQAVLPVANGSPTQPSEAVGVLPRVPAPSETESPSMLPRVPMQADTQPTGQGRQVPLAFPQVGIPGRTQAQEHKAQLEEQGSPISRIHNPVLKTLATVGDVLAGTFAPRAEQLIPGTEGNYALHLARAGNAVNAEQQQAAERSKMALEQAQTREHEANATSIEEQGKRAPKGNFIAVGNGLYDAENKQWVREPVEKDAEHLQEIDEGVGKSLGIKPTSDGRYLIPASSMGSLLKPKEAKQPRIEKGEDGTIYSVDLDSATGKPTLTTLVEGKGKKPQLSAEERGYMKAAGGNPDDEATWSPQVMQTYANLKRDKTSEGNIGTWQLEEQNGKAVLFNSKTGETKPAPEGLAKAGTSEKNEAKSAPMKAALSYGQSYLDGRKFTGPGDEALQEKFFELAKPSTGFRMTAPQMEMLMQSRAAMEGIGARIKHNIDPDAPWFGDVQRKNIVQTMHDIAKANNIDIGEAGGAQAAGGAKTYSQADVDAAVKAGHGNAKDIEDAFKAKGWTKK